MKLPSIRKDFGYTSDHDLLRKTARRLLDETCPLSEVRRLVDDARGYEPTLWREIVELGWTGLVVPESAGGAGLDYLALALLVEETGRCLLPAPFLSTVLAGIALGDDRRAAGIAAGETIATVALAEPGSWSRVQARARPDGDGYRIDGDKAHVWWAGEASLMIAPFAVDGGLVVVAMDPSADGVTIEPEVGIDTTRRTSRVRFEGARASADAVIGDADAWRRLEMRAWALLAAEMVGAAARILAITKAYACERVQFGRPIGSFQAVKHPLVDVMIAIEKARSLTYGAAAALDHDPDRAELHCRAAKASAEGALWFAADRGVQLHGGFGFTWDCDAHFFMKRAIASAASCGDAIAHRRAIADLLGG